jgi:hypothetical protein
VKRRRLLHRESDEFTDSLPAVLLPHHAGTITGDRLSREIDYIYTDAGVVAVGEKWNSEILFQDRDLPWLVPYLSSH